MLVNAQPALRVQQSMSMKLQRVSGFVPEGPPHLRRRGLARQLTQFLSKNLLIIDHEVLVPEEDDSTLRYCDILGHCNK
jgi:hypothetical protein